MIFINNIWRLKKKYLDILLSKKINISEKINFGSIKANNFFKKKIKNSNFFFEYGSGSSTIYVDKKNKKYISIETDKSFYKSLLFKLKSKSSLKYFGLGIVGEFSYPVLCTKQQVKNYIFSINKYFIKKTFPDLILIDGRFRIACCLNLLNKSRFKNIFTIILDDYKKRKEYHCLNKFFEIKKVGRLGILKPKKRLYFKKNIIEDFYFNFK